MRWHRTTRAAAAGLAAAAVAGLLAATPALAGRRHRHLAPLTGLPESAAAARRPALTVKIDNTPNAHPLFGINDADVVYEEVVEGGITRLAAVFNSRLPGVIGPVRSVRRTDRLIVSPLGGVFAFSGGAAYALNSIAHAPVQLFDEATAGPAMFRTALRAPPHNLLLDPTRLLAEARRARPPQPLFTFAAPGSPARGAPVATFSVNFPAGYAVSYTWDAAHRDWARSIFGAPERTAAGVAVAPTNVVVLEVPYIGGVGNIGAEADLMGHGTALVFSDGRRQRGGWFHSALRRPIALRAAGGRTIALRPGSTWVELEAIGETVTATAPRP